MILKFIYTLFIGILLALFVGFGIEAFYEEPKYPELPFSMKYARPIYPETLDTTQSAQLTKEQMEQEKRQEQYQKDLESYNRNVSVIGLVSAIIFMALSLLLLKNLLLISDGLLLGGVFTLLYAIARGFSSNDSKFQFIAVTVGLVISLLLGYIKFIKTVPTKKK